jgi:hypothetical protein
MLAMHAKRGVEATLERVFKESGQEFSKLLFSWSSTTAGVVYERTSRAVDATFMMPAVEDAADVPMSTYNHWLGFMLHELGHVWYTESKVWDEAVRQKKSDPFFHGLINGLEDPRIEQAVIDRGNNNASNLFQNLLNGMVAKGGEIEPDDFKNIPFMLALEGRRLNGYDIHHSPILPRSPWGGLLTTALHDAHLAKSTAEIVTVAENLYNALKKDRKSAEKKKGDQDNAQEEVQEDGQGEAQEEGQEDGNKQGKEGKEDKDGKALGFPSRDVEPTSFIEGLCVKVGLQTKHRPTPNLTADHEFHFGD